MVGVMFRRKSADDSDGPTCVRLLLDRTQPVAERDAAAESLMYFPHPTAVVALFAIASHATEDDSLRVQAAISLGVVWDTLGTDETLLACLPPHLQAEVRASKQPAA